MNKLILSFSVLLSLFLAACSSTGQPPAPTPQPPTPGGEYKQLGIVMLGDLLGQAIGTAIFVKYDKALPNTYTQDPTTRTTSACTVSRSGEPTPSPSPIPAPNPQPGDDYKPQYLSAGDAIMLKSNGLNYATLGKAVQSEGTYYANFALPRPLPTGLSLDVPGEAGGFPAFSNVPAGTLEDMQLTAPSLPLTNYVTPTTTFSWKKSLTSKTTVTITASAFDATTGKTITVACATPDTGSFSFPEATKTELGGDFKATSLSVIRLSGGVAAKGDALLMILTLRGVSGKYQRF